MNTNKPQILLTNDDGIESPGLWAAAEALSEIGYVWVVAPREQSTGMGRSMPGTSDGIITKQHLVVHGQDWDIFAVGGSPAQTVQHAIFEVLPTKPDLVVSGINYGINVGTGITISGTVGAAMEAASFGIPAVAISLDTAKELHISYSRETNFGPAAYFGKLFGQMALTKKFDPRVQVLKIDVPALATEETGWELTKLSTVRYYRPIAPERESWQQPAPMDYSTHTDMSLFPTDSDVHMVKGKDKVSVTPLWLDMTSPVDFDELEQTLRQES